MAFQVVPNTAEFRLVYDVSGLFQMVNTFHYRDTAAPWNAGHLANQAAALQTWWDTNVQPLVHAGITLAEIQYRDLGAEFGAAGTDTVGLDGTRAGDGASATVPIVVQWIGDAGAAPRRGYTFHSGGTEGDTSGDQWTAAFAGLIEDAYDLLRSTQAAGTEALVLVSRYLDGSLRAQGVTNTIQDCRVRQTVGSQRRRRRKAGNYVT